jgi:hypothetical protein
MLGLPHGEAALARGDDDTIRMSQDSILARAARLVPTRWILACLAALARLRDTDEFVCGKR